MGTWVTQWECAHWSAPQHDGADLLVLKNLRDLGLDVHAAAIAVAVADSDGTLRELGTIQRRPEAVRKLLATLGLRIHL